MRGSHNTIGTIEKILDQQVLAQVRRQARKVNLKSALVAALLTLLVLTIPIII